MEVVVPRSILKFVVSHGGKEHELALEFTFPATQSAPLPGDEVILPANELKTLGIEKRAFVVVKRRFVIGNLPPAVTSLIFLLVE